MLRFREHGGNDMSCTAEVIEELLRDVPPAGISSYTELIQAAREQRFDGAGVCRAPGGSAYILFMEGEPEGAVFSDSKGELFGDKALYLIHDTGKFSRYPLDQRVVERLVFGCRIHNKSHSGGQASLDIPEFGKKAEGIGRLILAISKGGSPIAGLPIRIRKDGQVVAHDITDTRGMVSFRLLYGKYELLVEKQKSNIDVYNFSFVPELQDRPLELEIS